MESITEDLAVLSESIGKVLSQECSRQAVHRYVDGGDGLDGALWRLAAEQGWLGVGLPAQAGGLALGAAGLDVLYRQLGRALAPGAFTSTLAAAQWLSAVAPETVRGPLLSEIVSGTCSFALPLDLDLAVLPLVAGTVSGQSPLMLGGPAPTFAVVRVKEREMDALAIVDLKAVGAEFDRVDTWDKTRSFGRIMFREARPAIVIPDWKGAATRCLRHHLCLAVAGDCVGASRVVVEQTIEYLKGRVQFDRPLASFQALKHRVADLMVAVTRTEELLEQAIEATDQGAPSAAMWACLANAAAGETFKLIAEDCLQLHGGVGFTWEFDCHLFIKRALQNREIGSNAGRLRDLAAAELAEATRAGTSTAELML